jgi:predicted metal-binding membrane protein
MDDLTRLSEQVAMLAPIVAAYVGVAKEFRMPSRYNHLLSLAVAALFVLVPEPVQQTLTTISVIGLTASGVYHFTKKRDKLIIEDSSSDDGTSLSKGAGKP